MYVGMYIKWYVIDLFYYILLYGIIYARVISWFINITVRLHL